MTAPDEASAWVVRCAGCSTITAPLDGHSVCPACGGLLDVERQRSWDDHSTLRARFASRSFVDGPELDRSGVWRYRELLFDVPAAHVVTYPEGNTPLVRHQRVTEFAGVRELGLKHEGMNPTGSFKDRGMTAGVSQARVLGARGVACASTGNTSASLAAYAARAGIPAYVFVPNNQVALGKLTQTLAYGARTIMVRGDFDRCLTLVRELSQRLGIYLLNSVNPYRIEGQKTIAIELMHQLGWNPPDWIALPAGNLGNTAAVGKALRELLECGLLNRVPRILAVQASGAAPFAKSYDADFSTRCVVRAETVATAIRIGDPASHDRAVRAIKGTGGAVVAVPDSGILEAKAVVDAAGIGCEPASAASVAGIRDAVARKIIKPDESVVAILTGHVLKDPGLLAWYHRELEPPPPFANRPVEAEADADSIERLMTEAWPKPAVYSS